MLTPCQLYIRSKTITPLRYADRPARAGLFPHWRPGPSVIQSGTANSSSVKNARRSAELLCEDGTLNARCARCAGRERNLSPVFPPIWPDEPGLRTWERKLSVRMRQRCDLRRGNAQREHLTAQEWVDSDSRTATSKGKGIWWATASLWAPTSQHRPAEPICAYGAMARATAIRKLFFQSSRGDAAARANAHSRRRS